MKDLLKSALSTALCVIIGMAFVCSVTAVGIGIGYWLYLNVSVWLGAIVGGILGIGLFAASYGAALDVALRVGYNLGTKGKVLDISKPWWDR